MVDSSRSVSRTLARVNAISLGITAGIVAAVGLFVATLALQPYGGASSRHLGLLAEYFPGYTVTVQGAFVGAFWAFLSAFVVATPAAFFYYSAFLKKLPSGAAGDAEPRLGSTVARLRTFEFSISTGLLAGVGIFAGTALLILNHEPGTPLGPHLRLVGQVLPGYHVTWMGGIVGFVYFLVIGAAVAGCVGCLYNRLVSSSNEGEAQ